MPDNFLIREQQVAAKTEATPGTAETLVAADVNLRPFQSSLTFAPEPTRFTNDEVADDIGTSQDFVGGFQAKLGFGCNFHGSGVLATKPALGIYLEACGLKEWQLKAITVGAPSGGDNAFIAGEEYSAASGTKTGIIEENLSIGGTLKYSILTGAALANTDVVVAVGTSATASGASSDIGWKYSPLSRGHKSLTIQRGTRNSNGTAAKDYLVRLKGALGTGRIEAQALDALKFVGEFSGALSFKGNGSMFTGVDYEQLTSALQPKLNNATIQINSVAVRPTSFTFDLGAVVTLDPDPTTAGGTAGYTLAEINSRDPKISIDPRRMPSDVLDDLLILEAGTIVPFQLVLGTSPNKITIKAPLCQIIGWSEQDASGRAAAGLELGVRRGATSDSDYTILFE